jgi:cytochrome c-type biogenesis protein CcmH
MLKRTLFIAAALLSLAFAVQLARAQEGATPPGITDDSVNKVAKQLFCPVCENVPLDVCPTQACIQWRATIREKLAAGWDEQQIKDYFVEQYGQRVLAEPSTQGLNIFVWLVPPLALLAGAFFLWRFLRGMTRASPAPATAAATPAAPADKYSALLEEELARRR